MRSPILTPDPRSVQRASDRNQESMLEGEGGQVDVAAKKRTSRVVGLGWFDLGLGRPGQCNGPLA